VELYVQKMIALIVTKLIPGDQSHVDFKTKNLDPIFIEQSTALALGQAKEEVLRMASFASRGLDESLSYLANNQHRHAKVAVQYEEAINYLDRKITEYLIRIWNCFC
jgi:phosphate:Na+ symporter